MSRQPAPMMQKKKMKAVDTHHLCYDTELAIYRLQECSKETNVLFLKVLQGKNST